MGATWKCLGKHGVLPCQFLLPFGLTCRIRLRRTGPLRQAAVRLRELHPQRGAPKALQEHDLPGAPFFPWHGRPVRGWGLEAVRDMWVDVQYVGSKRGSR